MAPKDGMELSDMLDFALSEMDSPVAIRYPRGEACAFETESVEIEYGKAEVIKEGKEVLILAVGEMVKPAVEVAIKLDEKKIRATVVNMRFIKPFDENLIKELTLKHRVVVTIEDGTIRGGFGEQVGAFLTAEKISVKSFVNIALPDAFIEHGSRDELFEKYGLDTSSIFDRVLDAYLKSK